MNVLKRCAFIRTVLRAAEPDSSEVMMTTARCAGNLYCRFIRGVCINVAALALIATALCLPESEAADTSDQLSNLSLEQLSNLEVTSVSKASEPLSQAASAIFVITHDDIVRSGATSIPEVPRHRYAGNEWL
jgi:hypothetical protein